MGLSGFSSELTFSVRDWFAWAPGRETRSAWRSWASVGAACPGEQESAEAMPALPMMLRRRATYIGQKAVGAALACRDVDVARYVIASRHGEYDRTMAIFGSLAAKEMPSPAEFSMSVHHGLAGLLSIHTGNRLGHVAISAAEDSFAYGLMEAALCVSEDPAKSVLLIYFDAPLPEAYQQFRSDAERDLPAVLAILLGATRERRISFQWQPTKPCPDLAESQALFFLRWLLSESPRAECQGQRMVWRWSRAH